VAPMVLAAEAASRQASSAVAGHPSLMMMLTGLWLAGVAATFCLFASRQARFLRSLGRLVPFDLDRAVLRAEGSGFGPAVIGALRPRIVVPADFEAQVVDRARAVVLTHERVHLERGDPAVNALATALQCLAWFNPHVHIGARQMRIDQEIACDAVVVARHPDARRLYAEALLNTLLMSRSIPLGCHWPPAGRHPLKERIAMLNSEPATLRRRTLGAALVCGISLFGAGAVWASKPAQPPLVTRPVWVQKPTIEDLQRYYPAQAMKAGAGGDAVIACGISAEGRLQNCTIKREDPAQHGFGAAALELSRHFQMKPVSLDGQATSGGRIIIPIRFAHAAAN